MAIHPQERLAIVAPQDLMSVPKFVDDSLWLAHLRTLTLSRGTIV
jgi:hypothetical protein